MSTNEKISAAESALQSGESVYSSCSKRLQEVQKKKQEIEQQNKELHNSFIQTQQQEQQSREQIEKCDHGIASIDQAISHLQSKDQDDNDGDNSSVQAQIADLQNSRRLLEQKKSESESVLHECQQRYLSIKSELLRNKNEMAQCEAEINRIHSDCKSSISSMGAARQPLLELIPALGAAAAAMQKISSLHFGKAIAAQKNAWSQAEMQRSASVSNNLSSCIAKTEQLLGATSANPTASSSLGGGNRASSVMSAGESWTETLSSEERSALRAYTGSEYLNINASLRNQTSFHPGNAERARAIHSALSKASIPSDCTVYRGTSPAALGEYQNLSDSELIGCRIAEKGFMSTSLNRSDSFAGAVQLEISVPAGARGAYIGYLSQYGHDESEVLFDADQVLVITDVRRDCFGKRTICAKMLSN